MALASRHKYSMPGQPQAVPELKQQRRPPNQPLQTKLSELITDGISGITFAQRKPFRIPPDA